MAWGSGNFYSVAGGEPISDGRLGSHFAARHMLNPTAVASASTINPSFNFDSHHVTGSTTIDTILVGGSVARNRVAYEINLIADAGATWATSSAGNIVPLTTAARTAGQAYTFRWDSIDQKWREIGLPGGAGSTQVFTNSNNSFSSLSTNIFTAPTIFSNQVAGTKLTIWDDTPTGNTN